MDRHVDVAHDVPMASDDIERLLAEVNATTSPSKSVAKTQAASEVSTRSPGGRIAFAVISGVGFGFLGWLGGVFLPFVEPFSCGVGAAGAAFVATLIAGPPRWFSS